MEALEIHLLRNKRWSSLLRTEDHLAKMLPRCPASSKIILQIYWTVLRRSKTWKVWTQILSISESKAWWTPNRIVFHLREMTTLSAAIKMPLIPTNSSNNKTRALRTLPISLAWEAKLLKTVRKRSSDTKRTWVFLTIQLRWTLITRHQNKCSSHLQDSKNPQIHPKKWFGMSPRRNNQNLSQLSKRIFSTLFHSRPNNSSNSNKTKTSPTSLEVWISMLHQQTRHSPLLQVAMIYSISELPLVVIPPIMSSIKISARFPPLSKTMWVRINSVHISIHLANQTLRMKPTIRLPNLHQWTTSSVALCLNRNPKISSKIRIMT